MLIFVTGIFLMLTSAALSMDHHIDPFIGSGVPSPQTRSNLQTDRAITDAIFNNIVDRLGSRMSDADIRLLEFAIQEDSRILHMDQESFDRLIYWLVSNHKIEWLSDMLASPSVSQRISKSSLLFLMESAFTLGFTDTIDVFLSNPVLSRFITESFVQSLATDLGSANNAAAIMHLLDKKELSELLSARSLETLYKSSKNTKSMENIALHPAIRTGFGSADRLLLTFRFGWQMENEAMVDLVLKQGRTVLDRLKNDELMNGLSYAFSHDSKPLIMENLLQYCLAQKRVVKKVMELVVRHGSEEKYLYENLNLLPYYDPWMYPHIVQYFAKTGNPKGLFGIIEFSRHTSHLEDTVHAAFIAAIGAEKVEIVEEMLLQPSLVNLLTSELIDEALIMEIQKDKWRIVRHILTAPSFAKYDQAGLTWMAATAATRLGKYIILSRILLDKEISKHIESTMIPSLFKLAATSGSQSTVDIFLAQADLKSKISGKDFLDAYASAKAFGSTEIAKKIRSEFPRTIPFIKLRELLRSMRL